MTIEQLSSYVSPAMILLCCLCFLFVWLADKSNKNVLLASASYFSFGLAVGSSPFFTTQDNIIYILFSFSLMATGYYFLLQLLSSRAGRRPYLFWVALLCGSSAAAASYFTFYSPHYNPKLAVTFLSYAIMFGSLPIFIFKARSGDIADRLVFWVGVILSVQFFAGAIYTIKSDFIIYIANYHQSPQWASLSYIGLSTTILLTFAIMGLLIADYLQEQKSKAERDALTGVMLRGAFEEHADVVFKQKRADELQLHMLMIDIDHFKSINDRFGHAGGDKVLENFGSLLSYAARASDLVGRMGGEEFGILLRDIRPQDALNLAERIRETCQTSELNGLPEGERVTVSIGVAQLSENDTFQDLYKKADRALYNAKHSGRNRVCADAESMSTVQAAQA